MLMLAFHGFLRIGEITVRSGVPAEHVIQRKDLVVVPGSTRHGKAKPSLQLTIRHGKHQKVGKPIVLEIDSQSRECPVSHICRYLKTLGQSTGPLFVFPDRTPSHAHISHRNYEHAFLMQVMTLLDMNVIPL